MLMDQNSLARALKGFIAIVRTLNREAAGRGVESAHLLQHLTISMIF